MSILIERECGSINLFGTIFGNNIRYISKIRNKTLKFSNDLYKTYSVGVDDEGKVYNVSIYLNGDKVYMISINIIDCIENISWDKWSEEKEMMNLSKLNKILENSSIANGEKFQWGSVFTEYNSKSGVASLIINYN